MGVRIKDLTGQRFGRLTVVEFIGIGDHGNAYWLCRCDCGNKKEIRGSGLMSKDSTSCGCYQKEVAGNRNRKPKGEANRNLLYRNNKSQAKRRGISFNLTIDQAEIFFQGDCYYCGAKSSNVANYKKTNGAYIYSGIDRVDNSLGYTVDNCVSCCKNCNKSKSDATKNIILRAAQFLLNKTNK